MEALNMIVNVSASVIPGVKNIIPVFRLINVHMQHYKSDIWHSCMYVCWCPLTIAIILSFQHFIRPLVKVLTPAQQQTIFMHIEVLDIINIITCLDIQVLNKGF